MIRLVVLALFVASAIAADPPACVVRVSNQRGPAAPDMLTDGGSGVVVFAEKGRSLVATNRHVIDAGGRAYCFCPARHFYSRAKVESISPTGDLALLSVPAELPVAELADAPAAGTPLTLWGFPHGTQDAVPKVGVVRGFEGTICDMPCLMTSIRNEDGDSGGGQFDAKNRLVCLSITKSGSTVPAGEIKNLLKRIK